MIVIVFGLPGSGKSYFASRLAARINADYLNSDRVRKNMFSRRIYSTKEKHSVYTEMIEQMELAIKQNRNLVLDATFWKSDMRMKFLNAASAIGGVTYIEIIAEESLIRDRLSQPRGDSEANFEVYKILKAQWEPLEEEHLVLRSTNDNIEEMLRSAARHLSLDRL